MIISNFLLQTAIVATTAASTLSEQIGNTKEISYLEFLMKGGVMIIPICILLFFTFYIIFERYISIKKAAKQDKDLIKDIRYELNAGKIDTAVMLCKRINSASGDILESGISIIGRPINEIESVMEKNANIKISQMEKGLGYLGLISGIAPILGFIGTITGVIKIFYNISISENISIGNISGGLYEKMISSGSGLIVGVIAYAAYHLFNMMLDDFSLNIQKQTLDLINIIQEPQHETKKK